MDYEDVNDISSESVRYEQPNTQALLEYSRLDNDLQDIFLTLSGKMFDPNTNKLVRNKYIQPLLNEEGVSAILMQLRPYFSRSSTFGSLKSDFINKKIKTTLKNIQRQLLSAVNQRRWNLDLADIEAVNECITTYVALNINRSKDGIELKALTTSIQSKEVTNQNSGKQKKAFGLNFRGF